MPADPTKEFFEDSPSPATTGEDFTPASSEGAAEEEAVRKLREEIMQLRDQLLRKQAEFENFRKRTEKEKRDGLHYALFSAVQELLPVLDGFERALASQSSGDDFRTGVDLIYQQFSAALQKLGVTPVQSTGHPFDPRLHEAVATVLTDEFPEHQIVDEMQRGYLLKDRLLRPAMVRVAKGASSNLRDEKSNPSE
jgi:molecular chaperone GrpE